MQHVVKHEHARGRRMRKGAHEVAGELLVGVKAIDEHEVERLPITLRRHDRRDILRRPGGDHANQDVFFGCDRSGQRRAGVRGAALDASIHGDDPGLWQNQSERECAPTERVPDDEDVPGPKPAFAEALEEVNLLRSESASDGHALATLVLEVRERGIRIIEVQRIQTGTGDKAMPSVRFEEPC